MHHHPPHALQAQERWEVEGWDIEVREVGEDRAAQRLLLDAYKVPVELGFL